MKSNYQAPLTTIHPSASRTASLPRIESRGLALVLALASLAAAAQSPVNDAFAERLPLGRLVETQWATNTLATSEPGEPSHRGAPAARSLWWRWVAPADGYVVVHSTNSPVRSRVAVYDGTKELPLLHAETPLNESGLSVAPDHFEFTALNGLHYNLAIDGRNGESGPVQLELRVYTTPELLAQPANATVTAGQRATLDARALGHLPLAYQWQFSTRSPNFGFTNVPGGTTRPLDLGLFGVVRKADEGWYRAVIQNAYGAITSAVARIDVNECALPLPHQPVTAATNVGKTVVFTAAALGSQPIFHQWQFKPANQFTFTNLPGATTATLLLTNLSVDQAGEYRYLASNVACTNQASAGASLNVSTNNALVLDPALPRDAFAITNQNASFDLRAIEGYQPIRYQWWFQPDGGPASRLSGETAPNLFLPGVQLDRNGWYWAVASNHWGSCPDCFTVARTRQARLTVETRPPNDSFEKRMPFFPVWTNLPTDRVTRTNISGWNKNATAETGEPTHQGRPPTNSVWWSFTVPVDGRVLLSLTAPGSAPALAVYTGNAVDGLTPVANRTNRLDFFDFVATNRVDYLVAAAADSGQHRQDNLQLEFVFNPDIGGPTLLGDFGGFFFMLGGGGDGDGGCRTFNSLAVSATSLDGVVWYQWQFGPASTGPFTDLPGQTNATLTLSNVTIAHQGWYRARVSNRSSSVVHSTPAYLSVNIGPVIGENGHPRSIATNACTNARFEVKAESCSPLTFQWRQNGVPVTAPNAIGVRSNILFIEYLNPGNAGAYDVVVTNAHLAVTSRVATLTITNAPAITAQPQSIVRHGCDPAILRVTAVADCPLTNLWHFRNSPLANATNATLEIPSVQPTDDGEYFAVVGTPFGSTTSQVARLTVQTTPAILAPPASQSVRVCDIVNLAVQPQGEPPCSWLSYQWQQGGTNLPGATNRVLTFEAQAETAGDYRVIVGNRWAAVTSAVARVTVAAQPNITRQPVPQQRVREEAAFTNEITVAICGALEYRWQHRPADNATFVDIANDTRHQVTAGGTLIVQNAQTNDSGFYRVIVSNAYSNSISSNAHVRVVRPPANDHFTNALSLGRTTPASAIGHNEFASIEAAEPAHGLQPPAHSVWWVWTNPFPSLVTVDLAGSDIDTTLGVYTGTGVDRLTTLAQDDDGGAAGRSRVSFMAGGAKTIHFAIDGKREAEGTNLVLSINATPITSPPVITRQPLNLAATAGQTVTFTNQAHGSPDLRIQWYVRGAPVAGTTRIVDLTNYLSTLTLPNITTNDDGVYYAVLSNDYGAVTTKLATLTFGSIVRGLVTDATKTTPDGAAVGIPGVLIAIGDVSTVTDEHGNYELVGVKPGELRADFMAHKTRVRLNEPVQFWNRSRLTSSLLTATKAGYYDYVDDQFQIGPGQTVAKRFSMSPIFAGLRFVMNWTNRPGDLDLLLRLPDAVPVAYPWIDYLPRNRGSTSAPPFALRDVDMTRGWGPETISIHRFYPGTYSLYARKYPGEAGASLAQSDARIVAYSGGSVAPGLSPQLKPLGSVTVPAGAEDWWHVCDIDGATTNITWINRLLATPPGGLADDGTGGGISPSAVAAFNPAGATATATLAFAWNFGDGSAASPDFEPVHPYTEPGWKTVTLTATDRTSPVARSHSTTKTNYIYVENLPPTVAITNPAPDTIFPAGTPIPLHSMADGIDDAIQQVDYFLITGGQTNFAGTATIAPYAWTFANATFADATLRFVARARDVHGAVGWSAPVTLRVRDLRGEILIVQNFASPEIDTMKAYLNEPMIREVNVFGQSTWRAPLVKVLDQEGLTFSLVRHFKLIIWNDQGQVNGGLTDNDVRVLQQAHENDIPLYLIGERLGESRNQLRTEQAYNAWTALLGAEPQGPSLPGPHLIHGIQPTFEDGLFVGWYLLDVADTSLPYSATVEQLALTSPLMDVAAEVPRPGQPDHSPLLLRYPSFHAPDFGEPRRLIQDFRVCSDGSPEPPESTASAYDRRILFVNGVAWLLRLFECQEVNVAMNCLPPPPWPGTRPDAQGRSPAGLVGQPMTFSALITQNGECSAGGVLVTNHVSPRLEVIGAEIVDLPNPAASQITVTNNVVIVRLAELPSRASFELRTQVIPRFGGWVTNEYAATRGLYAGLPCTQTAWIDGPDCAGPFRLSVHLAGPNVRLTVNGGAGCRLQIQTSTDVRVWSDVQELRPDRDPYDLDLPRAAQRSFFRLRRVD